MNRAAVEFTLYGATALVAAGAVGWLIRPKAAPTRDAMVVRSGADADQLRRGLGLRIGRPAVIEFMDFQCPPCRASWPQLSKTLGAHPGVTYRAVMYPLAMHPNAFGAAVALEVASVSGKGESAFLDLFTGKTALDLQSLDKYLSDQGLPAVLGTKGAARFERLVRADMKIGQDMHIRGTPTVFVLRREGALFEVGALGLIDELLSY